ncbi:MAG: hypothetical protein ACRYF0_07660 [Janthinobacterium lividum]
MEPIRVYSSQPVGQKLACAFLALRGERVVELPLAALPAPARPPRRRCTLPDDLVRVSLRLVEIGDQLNASEHGWCRLEAGLENGLRAERDALQSRQRAIQATLQAQKGGPADV